MDMLLKSFRKDDTTKVKEGGLCKGSLF